MKRAAQSVRRKKVRIIVADDSVSFRKMLIALCSALPRLQLVGQAGNGVAALAAIRRHRPDLVMLDLRMPRKGGLEVLKSIKEEGLNSTVIVLSGMIDEPHRRMCLELGAQFAFDKATELEAVRHLLAKM